MKNNFWNTRMQDLTVIQGLVWIMLYMIFLVVVWAAMLVYPQKSEEIWDWIESRFERLKEKVCGCRIFKHK